jgi:hypothetical protein
VIDDLALEPSVVAAHGHRLRRDLRDSVQHRSTVAIGEDDVPDTYRRMSFKQHPIPRPYERSHAPTAHYQPHRATYPEDVANRGQERLRGQVESTR